MIIIGELINTSRKDIAFAVKNRDRAFIQDIAQKQVEAGANYVDVNAGTRVNDEPESLSWLVETVQQAVDAPLCIDSPNPQAIEAALESHKGQAIINSITAEKERYEEILPLVLKYNARVIALCMDDTGMPETAKQRLAIVEILYKGLTESGLKAEDIFFDPLVKPISVNVNFGNEVLNTVRQIHQYYPGVHTTCGLSNVSYGLPNRKLLNQTFLVACMANGMNSVILDPLDQTIMSLITASKAVFGRDQYCRGYLAVQRKNNCEPYFIKSNLEIV
ncbi:MAG: methyltetrahydrofolate cobalamin methyltransferase [Clostridia bacterium]|nr:methyltetrahydrofolate cobalamin methyltransferase [Clostridia bacterium]